ncbi:hypothetical protein PINS_up020767 [Pythium insidiosum]|nr:hypothetical protein PINS_up020767 [Pythium insidiosum]
MGDAYNDVELISFHSVSKGFTGECGRRGGYMELVNISDCAKEQFYKMMSVNLCSNIEGQLMVGMMTNPPKEGDASYARYCEQRDTILGSLKRRAIKLVNAFNQLEGVTCNETEGAMYTFALRCDLPPKAVEAAKKKGMAPDALLLHGDAGQDGHRRRAWIRLRTGGSTWHFRSTILRQKMPWTK